MAKTPHFSEELLAEAVIKYSAVESGKIMASRLAEWARANIKGLEEVKDYHFTRSLMQKDPQTGKEVKIKRLCTVRMEELNAGRLTRTLIQKNPLLHSSSVEECLAMPRPQLASCILDAREQMDKLILENSQLRQKNDQLESKNSQYRESLEQQGSQLQELQEEVNVLSKSISRLIRMGDEAQRKAALESIGFKTGEVDLDVYLENLTIKIGDALSINDAVRGVCSETGKPVNILDGFDF